jgi:hypothetical protein
MNFPKTFRIPVNAGVSEYVFSIALSKSWDKSSVDLRDSGRDRHFNTFVPLPGPVRVQSQRLWSY